MKFVVLILPLLILLKTNAQLSSLDPLLITEIENTEEKNEGEFKDTLRDIGLLKNPKLDLYDQVMTDVLLYSRKNQKFVLPLSVWYYFDKSLNKNVGIRYYWGLYTPSFNPSENQEVLRSLTTKEDEFQKKYRKLKEHLIKKLGEPERTKNIKDDFNGFVENIFWEDSKKFVKLSIRFERKLKEIPSLGIMGDFKIEVQVTFK